MGESIQIKDEGTYYLDENGNRQPFLDENDKPYVGLLDGKGCKLPEGNDPVFLKFRIK